MRVIYKYNLLTSYYQSLMMPSDHEILSVAMQHGMPTLWALVDPEAPNRGCDVYCVGTGQALDSVPGKYVGTVIDGMYVWHFFEGAKR